MADFNPYQAPAGRDDPLALPPAVPPGCWRNGELLAMTRHAELPDRCVRCNRPAGGRRVRQTFTWFPPLGIEVGLCPRHGSGRRAALAASWLVVLGGLALFVAGLLGLIALGNASPWSVAMLILGPVLVPFGIWALIANTPVVILSSIFRNDYLFIDWVDPAFLADLPDWSERDPRP